MNDLGFILQIFGAFLVIYSVMGFFGYRGGNTTIGEEALFGVGLFVMFVLGVFLVRLGGKMNGNEF